MTCACDDPSFYLKDMNFVMSDVLGITEKSSLCWYLKVK